MSGNISINFRPSIKQYAALNYLLDDKTNYIGYGGAAFSGKSYLLCYWLTIMSISYPGTGWGLGRKQLTVLKKTTLLTLLKVFDECGLVTDVDYKYNQQNNIITFYNKSAIFLIDTATLPSDPLFTRFGGLELTGAAVDESAETDYKAIEILSTRLGRRHNDKYKLTAKLLETFNPAKNHIYTRYYKPYKTQTLDDNIVFIPALPSDNPSPEVPEYIRRIKSTGNQVTIQRLIYGNFEYDDDPSCLIPFEKIQNIFTNTFVANGAKYISADIARYGSDTTTIVYWSGLRAEKIVQLKKKNTLWVSQEIENMRQEYSVPLTNIIVDEDGVGGGVVDQVKCKGFVNNSSPVNGENFNNLKSQCYFKLAEIVNSDKLYVNLQDADLKSMLMEELEQVKQHNMDKDVKKQVMPKDMVKELIGRSPDISDSLMMRMYYEVKTIKERTFFAG